MATGYFGQELKVGDKIVFMAKSWSHYMRAAEIYSIEGDRHGDKVKVKIHGKKYDYKTGKYTKYTYIKRIYNYRTAIPLTDEQYQQLISKE